MSNHEPLRALALTALLLYAAAPAAAPLAPHHAVYEVSRAQAHGPSDVSDVRGKLEIIVEASCDGWRVDQFLGFRLYESDGLAVEHLSRLEGFESADGLEFWFTTRTYEDGEVADEVSGVARLDGEGGAGEVRFSMPASARRALPPGTVFPTTHIRALIAAAESGARHHDAVVFDGSTEDSPFEISTFIGPPGREAGAPAELSGLPVWPFRLAYYPVGTTEPLPEFEMSAAIFDNGVTGDMVYDYGDFAMQLRLREVRLQPPPRCP